jgi:hypothetical protein
VGVYEDDEHARAGAAGRHRDALERVDRLWNAVLEQLQLVLAQIVNRAALADGVQIHAQRVGGRRLRGTGSRERDGNGNGAGAGAESEPSTYAQATADKHWGGHAPSNGQNAGPKSLHSRGSPSRVPSS